MSTIARTMRTSAGLLLAGVLALAAAGCKACSEPASQGAGPSHAGSSGPRAGSSGKPILVVPPGEKKPSAACAARTPALCAAPECAALLACPGMGVLWGQVVDARAKQYPFPGLGGAVVSAWPKGAEDRAVAMTANAAGEYAFLASVGAPIFFKSSADGLLSELHAAVVPEQGYWMDLDMRSRAILERIFARPPGRTFDPTRGTVAIELIGASGEGGEGADLEPHGDPPFVLDAPFDKDWHMVGSKVLVRGGARLVIYPNVPLGRSKLTYLAPAGFTCASEATGVDEWPIEAGTVTQIDAVCARTGR